MSRLQIARFCTGRFEAVQILDTRLGVYSNGFVIQSGAKELASRTSF